MIILLLIAVIAILIAALVYASEAAAKLPDAEDLKAAKSRLVWVSVVGWIAIAILALLAVIFLFEGAELLLSGASAITYIVLLALLAMLAFTAWLTVSAARLISASTEYLATTDRTAAINEAYMEAYLAGALSLGTIIALVLVVLAYYAGRWSLTSAAAEKEEIILAPPIEGEL